MTDLETKAFTLIERAEKASHSERIQLQPLFDHMVTALVLQGQPVPCKLRSMNNTLKDEALDDMFDNMPV